MNRWRVIILAAITAIVLTELAATAASIINTKHDLSMNSTGGTIRSQSGSGGTTEICVFCHTPHGARTDAPLWNKTNVVGPYTKYTSDVLTALSYSVEDPSQATEVGYAIHAKTRICMSCHDGTIALGRLVNLPAGLSGAVAMLGTSGGFMPTSSAGYIGVDLRDDHPVAVKHVPGSGPGQDPELQAISGSRVRVYTTAGSWIVPTTASGGYVECTSCHDAHDNQYGKFLIDDNVGSKLCRSCHDKAGDDSPNPNESVHSNTTMTLNTPYSPPTGGSPTNLGTTVQNVKCMVCHYPHKSGITIGSSTPNPGAGKYSLTYLEEQTCYNTTNRWGQASSACHDAGGAGKNIRTEVTKGSGHRVANYSAPTSVHNAVEGSVIAGNGWLGVPGNSWHVECDDCHNSHTAGRLVHTPGTNAVSSTSALYGTGGTEPGWVAGWNAPTSFTYIEPLGVLRTSGANLGVTREYQICLKCHSYFAWGSSGPGSVPTPNLSDQAKEFNINQGSPGSYHPVAGLNPNRFATGGNVTRWVGVSGFSDTSLMFCSDCHGTDSTLNPQGPHGSNNARILVLPGNMETYGVQNGGSGGKQSAGSLCFKCHEPVEYNTDTVSNPTSTFTGFRTTANLNLHSRHAYLSANVSTIPNKRAYKCSNCHTRNAHGFKRQGLVVFRGDGAIEPYPAAYEAEGANTGLIDASSSLNRSAYGALKNQNCTTAAAVGCHQ